MAKTVDKKKTVIVETVETTSAPEPTHKIIEGRISGTYKVKFQPNGNNPSLGDTVKLIAATTAQTLVDKGFGAIIE